jgi:hypothetical protein
MSETTMATPAPELNEQCFKHAIFEWLAIPNVTTSGMNPLVRALLGSGVTRWSYFLMPLAENIRNLTYQNPPSPYEHPVSLNMKNVIMVALTLFHHASRKIGRHMDLKSITNAQFNTFCVEEYGPVTPPIHWKTPKPDISTIAADSWNHSNKPNAKDFAPAFKDDAYWIRAKERFQTPLVSTLLRALCNGFGVT